ncbi:MAG: hypothetical protein N2Z22_04320 [Turneriella sp.]|nr:hypothetical protein [Leptospiraceae bacterium]MCX7632541.1 hypothetical protein [Turneriella sp.]
MKKANAPMARKDLAQECSLRLESEQWDHAIAARVMAARKRQMQRRQIVLACLAMLTVALLSTGWFARNDSESLVAALDEVACVGLCSEIFE